MSRRSAAAAAILVSAAVLIACLGAMPTPRHPSDPLAPVAGLALLVVGLALAVAVGRRAYLHARLTRELEQLSRPATVDGSMVLELPEIEAAFVAGLLRPKIFWASTLAAKLEPAELRAVLLHERHHQLDRAPARLVVLEALAPVLTLFGAGRRWLTRRLAGLEVAADRHVIRHGVSRSTLARALLKMEPLRRAEVGIGFASATELRLRALLDSPVEPESGPSPLARWVIVSIAVAAVCLFLQFG